MHGLMLMRTKIEKILQSYVFTRKSNEIRDHFLLYN